MKTKFFLMCLIVCAGAVQAKAGGSNVYFQICDFKEMHGGNWTDFKGCTSDPSGDQWKSGMVYIIAGHSAKGLDKKGLTEDDQAKAAKARATYVKKILKKKGFQNVVVMPLALEIGSKVLVVYSPKPLRTSELEDLISKKVSDLEPYIDKKVEAGIQTLTRKKYFEFSLKIPMIFLPGRAVFGVEPTVFFHLTPDISLFAGYGVGYEADYSNKPADKSIAQVVEGGIRFNILKQILFLQTAFLYESDRDSKFYAHRDFMGGELGLEWRFHKSFSVGGFGLVGTGSSIPENYSDEFTVGTGVLFEVTF